MSRLKRTLTILLLLMSVTLRGQYITNGFWDNWFIGGGAGLNVGIDKYVENDIVSYPYGFALATELYMGKCLTPEFAIRIEKQGFKASCGGSAQDFAYVNGALMWDITSQLTGYREDRGVSCVPYLHAGIVTHGPETNFGLGCGIEAPIRLKEQLYLVPSWKFLAVHNVGLDALSSLTVSLRFYFDKCYWICYD